LGNEIRFGATLDHWTSIQTISYLGVTAHWLTDDLERKMIVIALSTAKKHTGKQMRVDFNSALKKN